ncbi:TRCF domain-containing protein, partial [Escherichia coli]|uniref:TRCF domain-containing protein n=1 Tax=Escherichia coli TaxID=562 RepID=UPI0022818813
IQIQEELIDRFGKLPEAAQTLLTTHRLRLAAQPLGIVKIDASETQALLQFGPDGRLMRLVDSTNILLEPWERQKLLGPAPVPDTSQEWAQQPAPE